MDDPCANAPWMFLSNDFHLLAREGVQLSLWRGVSGRSSMVSLGGRCLWKEPDGGMISLKASL